MTGLARMARVLAAALGLTLLLAAAEAAPPAVPRDLAPAAVEGFVAPLTDAQARELLIARLKAESAPPASPGGDDMASILLRRLHDASQSLRDRKDEIGQAIAEAPSGFAEAFANLTDLQGWPAFLRGLLVLLATLLAGGLAEWGVARVLGRGRSGQLPPAGYAGRLAAAGVYLAGGLLRLLTFAIVAYVASLIFLERFDPLREMVVAFALIVVGWRAVDMAADTLLAPSAAARRLAFADDHAARELKQHLVAFGGGIVVVVIMRGFLALIGVPPTLIQLLIVAAGIVVMVAMLAALIGDFLVEEGSPLGHVVPVLMAGLLLLGFLVWAVDVLIGWVHAAQSMVTAAAVLITLPTVERVLRGVVAGIEPARKQPRAQSDRWIVGALRLVAALTVASLAADAFGTSASAVLGQRAVDAALSVGVTILVATVIWQAIAISIDRKLGDRAIAGDGERDIEEEGIAVASRAETLLPLVRTFLWFALVAIVGMTALSNLGVDIGPLLAGAGVVGLAIGFGAQTLVRDIVAGIFFLVDDAFRVGEYIEFGNIRGEVEKISIRSLILRHHRGAIHVVPFGELKSITNYNRDWAIFKMEFSVPYDTDVEKVRRIVKKLGTELLEDAEYGKKFIEPLKSQGVVAFADSALVIRIKFKCKPREQFVLRRVATMRIKQTFDANGIAFAYPRVVVESAGGAVAAAAAAAALAKDEPKPAT